MPKYEFILRKKDIEIEISCPDASFISKQMQVFQKMLIPGKVTPKLQPKPTATIKQEPEMIEEVQDLVYDIEQSIEEVESGIEKVEAIMKQDSNPPEISEDEDLDNMIAEANQATKEISEQVGAEEPDVVSEDDIAMMMAQVSTTEPEEAEASDELLTVEDQIITNQIDDLTAQFADLVQEAQQEPEVTEVIEEKSAPKRDPLDNIIPSSIQSQHKQSANEIPQQVTPEELIQPSISKESEPVDIDYSTKELPEETIEKEEAEENLSSLFDEFEEDNDQTAETLYQEEDINLTSEFAAEELQEAAKEIISEEPDLASEFAPEEIEQMADEIAQEALEKASQEEKEEFDDILSAMTEEIEPEYKPEMDELEDEIEEAIEEDEIEEIIEDKPEIEEEASEEPDEFDDVLSAMTEEIQSEQEPEIAEDTTQEAKPLIKEPPEVPQPKPFDIEPEPKMDIVKYINSLKLKTPVDLLLATAFYMENFESLQKFTTKEISNRTLATINKQVSPAIFLSGVNKGFIEVVPDFTGTAESNEYALTDKGRTYVIEQLS